ncbi:hypothetical protein DK295_15335, partial [Listeria monocytogenes]|uniref:GIY-YIG nuclease family protein n=1 Tax=Listeria monocytogenes TaxID=1639 RepID=UPI000D80EBBD
MDCNSGIYKITNTINGNFYIGLSTNLKRRKSEHFSSAKSNKKSNTIYPVL